MLQLQSSRSKLHDWKKQKEPNFLQKNKLALKQNAKQATSKTNTATNKSRKESKKLGVTKPPLKGTTKSSAYQQQQQQQQLQGSRVTGEDSVVISKSALDNLLKQLVDAKYAANILPPIGRDNSITTTGQGDGNRVTATTAKVQQAVVTSIDYNESCRLQQKEQHHKDLDYSDVPGLSSSRPMVPKDSLMGEYGSVPNEERNMDVEQVYFPFGRPGGGAPNISYRTNQTDLSHRISPGRVDSEQHHQLSMTLPTSKQSPQDPINTSPRQRQSDISLIHAKSAYLDEWQVKEKEQKRRQNLDHYEFVRAQIAEKEQKREQARQRKALEEKQEEERIAMQREKLQREYQEEQERIRRKEEELARRNALMYQKIQEAKSTALEVKSKLSPRFSQNNSITVPAIFEEPHCSDYESGTDDPDSRANLDQVKVRLSFDSALRSPSMCNVIHDNSQGQEQSPSPKKHNVKSKSKPYVQQESVHSKGVEVVRQKKPKCSSTSKDMNATDSHKETFHAPGKKRERKPSKIPIPTKELLKNNVNEEEKGKCRHKEHIKDNSVHNQKEHRVSRKKAEKENGKQRTLATQQQNNHPRTSSPPVPALAKKLEKTTVNSTTGSSSQLTDHILPSLSTLTSKRAQQKAAKMLQNTDEQTLMPLANSVVRLQQSSLIQQQHEQVKPVSPPVPALAKKLQAQSMRKSSLTEFDDHNRSILPPITAGDGAGVFSPIQTAHSSQQVLPPVRYCGQPMAEYKSNSPPVPALAKQLNQQWSHTSNHIDSPVPPSIGLTHRDYNKPISPELNSDSQFTHLPEMEEKLAQEINHTQHGLQQTQPIMHIPVSAHQLSNLNSYCSINDSVCRQNSQQMHFVAPQIVSPVQIMVPLSSPQPHNWPAGVEQRRESSNSTAISDEDVFQSQHTNSVPSPVHLSVEQHNNAKSTLTDGKPLCLPPTVATTAQGKMKDKDHDNIPVQSVTAASQLSPQNEEVLQHLTMMKKRLLAQQQSIAKRQLSSSFKSSQQSNNNLPPLL